MFSVLKKLLATCLIGFGLGILLVILLHLQAGFLLLVVLLYLLVCFSYVKNRYYMEVWLMTVVVKKVPKWLRGFVKIIFGVKDDT